MAHICDLSTTPLGGLITLERVTSALVDCMNNRQPVAIADIANCPKCSVTFALNMTALAAGITLERNPNSRMGYELQLAAIQAAIARGETDTPPEGFGT